MEYYGQQDVLCPFLCGENKNNIFCEGLVKNTQMISHFELPSDKKVYKYNYCESYGWMDCPYAKILDIIKYQEDNNMAKTLEEKLESAQGHIKRLKEEMAQKDRDCNALHYQVKWREQEMKKQEAKVKSTELLTKYLVDSIGKGKEVRVKISDLAKFQEGYDIICVVDNDEKEIVCTLYDKGEHKILDMNYNDYLKYCKDMVNKHGKGKVFADFVRVKDTDVTKRAKLMKIIKAKAAEVKYPVDLQKRLKFEYKIFAENEGSIIVAWFAIDTGSKIK